jgi:hypothetical protein
MADDPGRKPTFDPVKAAFFLVGMVLGSYLVVAFTLLAFCWMHESEVVTGRYRCDADSRVYDLLTQALSAALAFAGGYATGRKS